MKRLWIAVTLLTILAAGCAKNEIQETQILVETLSETETMSGASGETSLDSTEAAEEATGNTETADEAASGSTEAAGEAAPDAAVTAAEAADRTVYAEGFFYEPLNDAMKERINGLSYKEDCTVPYGELRYLSVLYTDFDGNTQTGEVVCNRGIAQDLAEIFYELYQASYPIGKIRLIDEYGADDDLSCLDNNTSSFNYRPVEGSSNLSKHALGLAIDINPFYNPYVTYPNGVERISPEGSAPYADRSQDFPYKIDENDLCYRLFTEHGFTWGGHWKTLKDYQHFQKALP